MLMLMPMHRISYSIPRYILLGYESSLEMLAIQGQKHICMDMYFVLKTIYYQSNIFFQIDYFVFFSVQCIVTFGMLQD